MQIKKKKKSLLKSCNLVNRNTSQHLEVKKPILRSHWQGEECKNCKGNIGPTGLVQVIYNHKIGFTIGQDQTISMFEPVTVNGESQSQYRRGYDPTADVPNVDQNLRFPPRVNNPLDYDVLNCRGRHFPPGKAKPCPSYDGKISFRDFLIQFEMIGEYNQWSLNVMASQLAMCLKDQAVAVLADLSPFRRRHYDSLVAALRERFEPDNQSQLHRAQLKSRIRRENEPLPQLAHDIRRLVRDANPGVPLDIRENMAKDSFLDALNDRELELAVFQSQPKTMQDALKQL